MRKTTGEGGRHEEEKAEFDPGPRPAAPFGRRAVPVPKRLFSGSNLSRRAAGVYPPVRSLFTPDFFPAPVPALPFCVPFS